MNRYSVILIALCLLLVLVCSSASLAVEYPKPNGYQTFQMRQGWYNGGLMWYITLSTSSIQWASSYRITYAPLLASANAAGAPDMYWVTNYNNNGPAFTTAPGLAPYSGLWDVQLVTWLPGVTPWVITNPAAPAGSPPGLPTALQATIVDSDVIVDYPVMAVGPLGGPWYPASPGRYRIKMGSVYSNYQYTKLIKLPTFDAFCQDAVHQSISTSKVVITDAATAILAAGLGGANVAAGLTAVDAGNTQDLWFIMGGPYLCQKLVSEYCPTSFSWANTQLAYSPVMNYIPVTRGGALPPSAVINNPDQLQALILAGLLLPGAGTRVNANIVPVN